MFFIFSILMSAFFGMWFCGIPFCGMPLLGIRLFATRLYSLSEITQRSLAEP